MTKKYLFFAIFFTMTLFCFPQNKKLTCDDAARQNPKVLPQRLRNLQWLNDNNSYVYVYNNILIRENARKNTADTLLQLKDLQEKITEISSKIITWFPEIKFIDNEIFNFMFENQYLQYNTKNNQIKLLNSFPENAQNIDIDDKTANIAYTIDNNLFLSFKQQQKAITNDKEAFIVNGQAVHRFEFGIEKGTFWSPQGNKLAFYRMNEGMVTEYPIVDISERIATTKAVRYPMAGMTSHEVSVGIYDIATERTIFLQSPPESEKDQYWTNITWSPDAKFIYIAIINREQNVMKLCQFDAVSGDFIKQLYIETNDRYVEPMNGMMFFPNSTTKYLWLSKKDGFNHFYMGDIHEKVLRQLTTGEWDVLSFGGFDERNEHFFFTATKESPLQTNVYSYNLRTEKIIRISLDHGTHAPIMNKKGTMCIDIFSSTDIPYSVKIETSKGVVLKNVFQSENPLQEYKLGEMIIDNLKSDNGMLLYYRLIKPVDFDTEKKYPVIVYVYGGPHAQLITDSWLGGNDMFLYYLSQEGYVVFTIDNQGSANRGFEFESIIHHQVGVQEIKDQMVGINFLKQLSFVDTLRLGIDGWSYGGFMTIKMLLDNPGVFKAGCAGGPVCDWKYYEVMYGERYMGTPQQNPIGYANSSLIEHAAQLKDRLLIIHGDVDPTVVWQQSLAFIKACISNGIQVDYFVYPGHEHNVRGKDRAHLYRKITDFFDKQLK